MNMKQAKIFPEFRTEEEHIKAYAGFFNITEKEAKERFKKAEEDFNNNRYPLLKEYKRKQNEKSSST